QGGPGGPQRRAASHHRRKRQADEVRRDRQDGLQRSARGRVVPPAAALPRLDLSFARTVAANGGNGWARRAQPRRAARSTGIPTTPDQTRCRVHRAAFSEQNLRSADTTGSGGSQEIDITVDEHDTSSLTFWFRLCYVQACSTMPSRAKLTHPPHSKVLLVDGHRAGLRARCMVLEEEGHVATGVASPDEALQLLTEEKFGVIVTEFKLIGTTGPEFIAKLRQVAPGTPVLLLSGYVDALGLSERSTGADAVLMKS